MSVELLSPAGSLEKLRLAFEYGADAAYMGLSDFSLRANARNFTDRDLQEVSRLKQSSGKRLYGTLNMIFDEQKLSLLQDQLGIIKSWPFDAFIISDLGLVPSYRMHWEITLNFTSQPRPAVPIPVAPPCTEKWDSPE